MKLFTLVFGLIVCITYGVCKQKYEGFDINRARALMNKYLKIREELTEKAKVQGGSFSLTPPKPNKALQMDKKIPEKCKGKDTCHDFRLCKLCMPYWAKFNKLNSDAVKEEKEEDDDEDEIEKVGIDAADPGYDEAYEVSSESEEESSGYDW